MIRKNETERKSQASVRAVDSVQLPHFEDSGIFTAEGYSLLPYIPFSVQLQHFEDSSIFSAEGNSLLPYGVQLQHYEDIIKPFLAHAGLFGCFHNPPESDMDYAIFEVSMLSSACAYIQFRTEIQ